MAQEIERKFLLTNDGWRADVQQEQVIRQGYLSPDRSRTVRVRVSYVGTRADAWLTIKGPSAGIVRSEYEYAIPVADAEELLTDLCIQPLIEKTRYQVPFAGRIWEVDVFHAANQGLMVAEVELPTADTELVLPSWVGADVSSDGRYTNAALVRHPYSRWIDQIETSGGDND